MASDLPLSQGELNGMRSTSDVHLGGTAVIQRTVTASDGQGGLLAAGTSLGTVSARLGRLGADEFGGQEIPLAGRLGRTASRVLTMPANTDIDEKDIVVYTTDATTVTLEIVEVYERPPFEIIRRVRAREVD